MTDMSIPKALGLLQEDPDNEVVWGELKSALGYVSPFEPLRASLPTPKEDLAQLLLAARGAHAQRGESEAATELLRLRLALLSGAPEEASAAEDLARALEEEMFDDDAAAAVYERLLALNPNDMRAEDELEKYKAKRAKWRELVARYLKEAKAANEASFRSSLLVSAAEVTFRFGRKEDASKSEALSAEVVSGLREALDIDPKNRRASMLLRHVFREKKSWKELADTLSQFGTETVAKEDRVRTFLELGRVALRQLKDSTRAIAAYEAVIELSPGHPEATNALVAHLTETEKWDDLVSFYERQLSRGTRSAQDVGTLMQAAMVHWRMRNAPELAEPHFEALRRYEPAHPMMLAFFRTWCTERGDTQRLSQILTDAQKAIPDGAERSALALEIANLAEGGANAAKAIEQWRAVLRQEPNHKEAKASLRRLYRQNADYTSLADLLRNELERLPEGEKERLPLLREVAEIYRVHLKSDNALVSALSQIVTLDPADVQAVRELARVYDTLGRTRELLATETRLAEIEPDVDMKVELYRSIAERWLDQFSNVQNAVEAYEKLREFAPHDKDAIQKLKDLYQKRRAYKALFDLEEVEAKTLVGEARRALWLDMAKIASERLDRGDEATRLYKAVLDEDPSSAVALDSLEKQAERDKDFVTVADVLERRSNLATDTDTKLAVLLKLGSVYQERLNDNEKTLAVYTRVLEVAPAHQKAVRVVREGLLLKGDFDQLEKLYAQTGDYEGLVEILSSAADKTTDTDLKVSLSYRAADIASEKLNAPEKATRALERVLGARPDDKRAALGLIPFYEREERWARLPPLYEVVLQHVKADDERLEILNKLAEVAGERLRDRLAAYGYAERAYKLRAHANGALERFEAWAERSGEWGAFGEALRWRLTQDPGAAEAKTLKRKLAQVASEWLGAREESIAIHKELLEQGEDSAADVAALDALLREASRSEDLRWLFRWRIDRSKEDSEKIALLKEWAGLEEEVFSNPAGAINVYKELVKVSPKDGAALYALSRLLMAAGDHETAKAIVERDRDLRDGKERAQREVELAKLSAGPLHAPKDALNAALRALEIVPGDPGAIEVLEQLLPVGETRASAATKLEEYYRERGNLDRQIEVLGVMIGAAASRADRVPLYVRLAEVRERQGNAAAAFEVMSRAAMEYPSELDLWDRLAVLANRARKTHAFVDVIRNVVPPVGESGVPVEVELDLAERAATLHDEMLGEPDKAAPYLDRILNRDPTNDRAFFRLKQILTSRARWSELEGLYERVLAATSDGPKRADLLADIALVAEEITNDGPKAIAYYERILDIEPSHEIAVRALDSLYADHGRWAELAKLIERRVKDASGDQEVRLKLKLATILETRLSDAKSALGHLEEVLAAEPNNQEAIGLVEKTLDVIELRPRAALLLEGVYADRPDVRDLLRVLEVRLETTSEEAERRELTARVAELTFDKIGNDHASLDAYARLVPLAPEDTTARQRLIALGQKLTLRSKVADVLDVAVQRVTDRDLKAEMLTELGVEREAAGENTKAESAYRRMLELDREDAHVALPAARALERLYSVAGRERELCEMLLLQAQLEENVDTKRALYKRLGELRESALGDKAGAISAWREAANLDAFDDSALASLDRLYTETGANEALVGVLAEREKAVEDGAKRRELLMRKAAVQSEKLNLVEDAIATLSTVVDDFGQEKLLAETLSALYQRAEKWPDLVESLEAELALTDSVEARVALLFRIGEIRRARLEEVGSALEAFRDALALDASHAGVRAQVEALLTHEGVRREAADVLRPIYEEDKNHEGLIRTLDIQIEFADTAEQRITLFALATDTLENSIGDAKRAFTYAAKAFGEAASTEAASTWYARVEALAEKTGDRPAEYETLAKALENIVDEILELNVTLRIGDLARHSLKNIESAERHYKRVIELKSDDARALSSLEAIYTEKGAGAELLEILKMQAEAAEDASQRKAILEKQAEVAEKQLDDKSLAIVAYEEILESAFDEKTAEAVAKLYAATERWGDLISLYERELGIDATTAHRRAHLHYSLGKVHEEKLGEIERAFDEYQAALKQELQHAPTVAAVEALLEAKVQPARAAEMLEKVYLARLDWEKVIYALRARLVVSEEAEERRDILSRLAKIQEEQTEDFKGALDSVASLLAEGVTDESTWHELERVAQVAGHEERVPEIYAAELDKIDVDEPETIKLALRAAEQFLANDRKEEALRFYRRAHQFAPEERADAFEAIDKLLVALKKPKERIALYREALERFDDAEKRFAVLLTIAQIEEADLGDREAAVVSLQAALDVNNADARALDPIGRLYVALERHEELAEHLRHRAELSEDPAEESRFRLDLAKLLESKLGEASRALDEYERVVEAVPDGAPEHARAVAELERLIHIPNQKARVTEFLRGVHEKAGRWQSIVDLTEHRLAIAENEQDRALVLKEKAHLLETKGGDLERAFGALREAFILDPKSYDIRGELERVAGLIKHWDELAAAYETAATALDGTELREVLEGLAKLHDEKRDDPRRSLQAWDRVFRLDEMDPKPLEQMDALATLLSDWPTLVRVLAKRAELASSDEERASTWRRIGESRRDMLDDAAGAIEAYERALELEPESTFTIDNLIPLYESKNDAARLVSLYRKRLELADPEDTTLRFELLVAAAMRSETGLGDRREAISLLHDALLVHPKDPTVLAHLERLLTAEKLWPDLLQNLEEQWEVATENTQKRKVRARMAHLLTSQLDDHERALNVYREILEEAFDEDAASAVKALGEARDDYRLQAATVLEAAYEKAERYRDFVGALELRHRAETEARDRVATMRRVAATAETKLGDNERALDALLRAMAEAPEIEEIHTDAERVAALLGQSGYGKYADALRDKAGSTFDAKVTAMLYRRLGRVMAECSKDPRRAIEAYLRAAEHGGDTAEVLVPLERLYTDVNDHTGLLDVIERRIAIETGDSTLADLLARLADLQIEVLGERGHALSTLRSALEKVKGHEASRVLVEKLLDDDALFEDAFEVLEKTYRDNALSEQLASLVQRRIARARTRDERIRAELDVARVYENEVGDPKRAQRFVERAFQESPDEPNLLTELERIAEKSGEWAEMARTLSEGISALEGRAKGREIVSNEIFALLVKLAHTRRDRLSDPSGAEAALHEAFALTPTDLEVLREIETLQRAGSKTRELVDTLRKRATLEKDSSVRQAALKEAKEIAESQLNDRDLVEASLRELLRETPKDAWTIDELTKVRDQAKDYEEVVLLLARRADLESDPKSAREWKHKMAETFASSLSDPVRARSVLEEIFNEDPADERAASRLREIYTASGKDHELAGLLIALVGVAPSLSARSQLRMELAELQSTKLGAPGDAILTLRAVVDENPEDTVAADKLTEMLERSGDDHELVKLLKLRAERAHTAGDAPLEIRMLERLADVSETRLHNTEAALLAYEDLASRAGDNKRALVEVARLAEARGVWEKAADALTTLVELETGAVAVGLCSRLAEVHKRLGNSAGEESALRKALSFDRGNPELWQRLETHLEGRECWPELAVALHEHADVIRSANPDPAPRVSEPPPAGGARMSMVPAASPAFVAEQVYLLKKAADVHRTRRNAPSEAIPLLERATELVPHDRELLLILCDTYNAASREQDAARALERVIASFGPRRTKELAQLHHRLGRTLLQLGDQAGALAQYDLAFKIDPGSTTVLRDLGLMTLESGDLERAQKTFRALLLQRFDAQSGITKAEVFYYLAVVSQKQGDKAKAIQMCERSLENDAGLEKAKVLLAELKG